MYAIYGNIYHPYTPNVSIYTIHGSYGYTVVCFPKTWRNDQPIGCLTDETLWPTYETYGKWPCFSWGKNGGFSHRMGMKYGWFMRFLGKSTNEMDRNGPFAIAIVTNYQREGIVETYPKEHGKWWFHWNQHKYGSRHQAYAKNRETSKCDMQLWFQGRLLGDGLFSAEYDGTCYLAIPVSKLLASFKHSNLGLSDKFARFFEMNISHQHFGIPCFFQIIPVVVSIISF